MFLALDTCQSTAQLHIISTTETTLYPELQFLPRLREHVKNEEDHVDACELLP